MMKQEMKILIKKASLKVKKKFKEPQHKKLISTTANSTKKNLAFFYFRTLYFVDSYRLTICTSFNFTSLLHEMKFPHFSDFFFRNFNILYYQ